MISFRFFGIVPQNQPPDIYSVCVPPRQPYALFPQLFVAAPPGPKRTRAESLINNIGVWSSRIGDLEFPDFTKAERTGSWHHNTGDEGYEER